MNKNVSLKDIAARVGVSAALVSYVLNNKKEGRIKKSVAEKIRQVAREMNYRTNQIAKSLKTSKTFTIGLIVADIANPFSAGLARIIENEADKNNYTVIFGSSDENAIRSNKLIETFLNRQVDGLIIAPAENAGAQILSLQQQQVPFVLVDRYFPNIPTNYVSLDNYAASLAGVQHLIDRGYRRIGMISFHTILFNMQERERGYIEALEKNGIAFVKDRLLEVSNENMKTSVENAIDQLQSATEPIDALLFASNAIAIHGLKYISGKKVKVPEQLALVSFDKTDALDLFYAPLTYINQPLQEIGRLATSILINAMEGDRQLHQVNLPGTLVTRASTGADQIVIS